MNTRNPSIDERDWSNNERRIAAGIRAQGGDVRVTIKNGRRLFEAHYPAKAQRLAVHGVPQGSVTFQ